MSGLTIHFANALVQILSQPGSPLQIDDSSERYPRTVAERTFKCQVFIVCPMAKKVKVSSAYNGNITKKGAEQPKEETYEFVPSEFNEKTYIEKDILGTKVTLIFALVSILVGFAAGSFSNLTGTPVWGFVLIAVVFAGMRRFLNLIGFDTMEIKASSMLGNYITSVFLILCIWTIMINPPFI
jgi:hypothetical protein